MGFGGGDLARWERQALAMQRCRSAGEVLSRHGPPSHKERAGEIEIWHYPLGTHAGHLYAIHVAVSPDQSVLAYLHFVPTGSRERRWWNLS